MSTINSNSSSQHQDIVDRLRPLAMAIPAGSVRMPDIPVATYIDEGLGFVSAGREHRHALVEVGMDPDLIENYEQHLFGLQAVQAQWNKERNKGRSETTLKIIDDTAELRSEALDMADLALRNNGEGQRRLSSIRGGEGLADQVADLLDLALLFRDATEIFATVRIDANDMAAKLEAGSTELQNALSKEDAQKSLCITKELRDRYYTLCVEPLREIRAFADFAFRKDKGNNRRFAFTSAYVRRSNRRRVKSAVTAIMSPFAGISG